MPKHSFKKKLHFPEALNLFQVWHTVVPFSLWRHSAADGNWVDLTAVLRIRCGQVIGSDTVGNGKQHKNKLARKAPVRESLLFFFKHKHSAAHATATTHPACWRCAVMPRLSVTLMFRPAVWEEHEGPREWQVKHTTKQIEPHTFSKTAQKDTGDSSLVLLTAPAPYRHHPVLLASGPDTEKRKGRCQTERNDK